MKKIIPVALLLILISLFSQTLFAQGGFPYHLYAPRTLAELNELNDSIKKPDNKDTKNMIISAKPFYSAIRFVYMGKNRKMAKQKWGFFRIWAESLNIKSDTGQKIEDMFEREFLFKECDKEYWIPVQTPAVKDMLRDAKKGERITLYLMMAGGIETDGKWEYIYFTNSFKVYE